MIRIIIFLILANSMAFAQDDIYQKGHEFPIEAKIIEINESEIKYKKFNNQEGPIYKTLKNNVSKIVFENGTKEIFEQELELQKSPNIVPTSRLFIEHNEVNGKRNTDGEGVKRITEKELQNLTKCDLVNSADNSDFIVSVKVIKGTLGNRKAKIIINQVLTGDIVYESKWVKGAPSEFNGFSGTRRAIGKIIKKDLLTAFPEISVK